MNVQPILTAVSTAASIRMALFVASAQLDTQSAPMAFRAKVGVGDIDKIHKEVLFFSKLDLNECQVGGYCSQVCQNEIGGYKCSCQLGYGLAEDNSTCQGR